MIKTREHSNNYSLKSIVFYYLTSQGSNITSYSRILTSSILTYGVRFIASNPSIEYDDDLCMNVIA
jgi:hypothetical protein